jgi:hypothetical protein
MGNSLLVAADFSRRRHRRDACATHSLVPKFGSETRMKWWAVPTLRQHF